MAIIPCYGAAMKPPVCRVCKASHWLAQPHVLPGAAAKAVARVAAPVTAKRKSARRPEARA